MHPEIHLIKVITRKTDRICINISTLFHSHQESKTYNLKLPYK